MIQEFVDDAQSRRVVTCLVDRAGQVRLRCGVDWDGLLNPERTFESRSHIRP